MSASKPWKYTFQLKYVTSGERYVVKAGSSRGLCRLTQILQCVEQAELEKFDGVSQGKYTIGLGQTKMSFCDDREGIIEELVRSRMHC